MSVLVLDDDIKMHELENVDNAIIKEKNEVMHILNQELDALKDIMTMIGLQITQDGESIEVAAENISECKDNVQVAVQNLEEAQVYAKTNRNMKIGMAAGGLTGGVVGLAGLAVGPLAALVCVAVGIGTGVGLGGIIGHKKS